MSTIKTNTLTGTTSAGSIVVTGEGGSTTTNLQQGLLKNFLNMNGTGTIAIRDSFNTATAERENWYGDANLNATFIDWEVRHTFFGDLA